MSEMRAARVAQWSIFKVWVEWRKRHIFAVCSSEYYASYLVPRINGIPLEFATAERAKEFCEHLRPGDLDNSFVDIADAIQHYH